jgi:hypothetical protein
VLKQNVYIAQQLTAVKVYTSEPEQTKNTPFSLLKPLLRHVNNRKESNKFLGCSENNVRKFK